jgi:hypothetical protein
MQQQQEFRDKRLSVIVLCKAKFTLPKIYTFIMSTNPIPFLLDQAD